MRARVREQRHLCGPNYMEVDIYPISEREHRASARSKQRQATRMVQANLNARNSARHLMQLVNTNFTDNDLHVVLPYFQRRLPATEDEAERDLDNWIRRVNYLRARRGYPPARVIAVTEHQEAGGGRKKVNFHHHVIISGDGLTRDELEAYWSDGRQKDLRKRQLCGYAHSDRLRFDQDSLEGLANYLMKYPKRKKRWRQSEGLKQPRRPRPNDSRYSRGKVARLARERVDDPDYWNRQYPGWELNGGALDAVYHEQFGWYLYLKMRRIRPTRKKG